MFELSVLREEYGGKVAIFTFQLGVELSCSYLCLDPFQLGYISLKAGLDQSRNNIMGPITGDDI